MKKSKKIIRKKSIMLSVILILCLTACGSDSKTASNTTEASVTESSTDSGHTSQTTESKTDTTDSAASENTGTEATDAIGTESGNTDDGNSSAENQTSESQSSDNQTSDNQSSDNQASDNQTSDNQASDNQTSGNQTSESQTSDNQTSENQASDNQPSQSPTSGSSASGSNSSVISSPTDDYFNIAIFGLDVNTNLTKDENGKWKQLNRGFRSDCTMIASINRTTGDIKIVSVYRDTFLNTGNNGYHKSNAAFAKGGPTQAVTMLNQNLDLNIEKYISISYHSLMELIDGLGGITVDVEKAALNEINGYQNTIVTDLGLPGYTPVTESGPQVLNGLQVCAYCRLRHDFPRGDLDRAAHQRKVLRCIEEKVKQTDLSTLTTLFNSVSEKVNTNIDTKDLLDLVSNVDNYRIAGDGGFPADNMVTIATLGSEGSCVVPINLENNVIWLHSFLFGEENYTPSETLKGINATIEEKIAPYVKKKN